MRRLLILEVGYTCMSRKQTITFPDDLHTKLAKAAVTSGLSLNRYVIQRLRAKNDVVFVELQELTQALARLQVVLAAQHCDDYVRQEVQQLCRFCVCSLVQMTKRHG